MTEFRDWFEPYLPVPAPPIEEDEFAYNVQIRRERCETKEQQK